MKIYIFCANYYKKLTKNKKFQRYDPNALPLYTISCQSKHIKLRFFGGNIEILIPEKTGDIQLLYISRAQFLLFDFCFYTLTNNEDLVAFDV